MKWTKNKQFLLAIAVPILVLLFMTVKPLLTTFYGETVYLQTIPYDPRDLFYGDYVDLNFEAETVDSSLLDKSLKFATVLSDSPRKVYIILEGGKEADSFIHHVTWVTKDRPFDGVYIEGTLTYVDNDEHKAHIDLPIERYYIPEGTGKKLEDDARKGRLVAEVKVFRGYPILVSVKKAVQ